MNDLIPTGAPAMKMSSREIGELTGKQHQHVKRDIEKMLSDLKEDASSFGRIYLDSMNREQTEYLLDRELTDTLLTGYSTVLRRKVIARWRELEQVAADPRIPKTYVDALRLAADQADEIARKDAQLAIAAPKAAALDRIALETDGAVCLRIAAKLVQVPEKQFLQFLNSVDWIFRHHHSQTWSGYSDKEKAGFLELKYTKITRDDGSEKTVEQVLITPLGLAKVAELIERKAPWLRKVANQPPRHLDAPTLGAPA